MKRTTSLLLATVGLLFPRAASAHVSIASGIGLANGSQEVTFGIGHGCEGADTYRVRVEIPAGVTSVRPMRSDFGKTSVEKDAAGTITAVVWQKADADALEEDLNYYKLVVRLKAPDKPLTSVSFLAHQTCRAGNGTISTVDWVMKPGDPVVDGGAAEPAPTLFLVPAHKPGWNKLVAAQAVTDLGAFFGDALIVWKDAAAYSANATTTDLIKSTPGVTPLTSLAAGDTIWVRY